MSTNLNSAFDLRLTGRLDGAKNLGTKHVYSETLTNTIDQGCLLQRKGMKKTIHYNIIIIRNIDGNIDLIIFDNATGVLYGIGTILGIGSDVQYKDIKGNDIGMFHTGFLDVVCRLNPDDLMLYSKTNAHFEWLNFPMGKYNNFKKENQSNKPADVDDYIKTIWDEGRAPSDRGDWGWHMSAEVLGLKSIAKDMKDRENILLENEDLENWEKLHLINEDLQNFIEKQANGFLMKATFPKEHKFAKQLFKSLPTDIETVTSSCHESIKNKDIEVRAFRCEQYDVEDEIPSIIEFTAKSLPINPLGWNHQLLLNFKLYCIDLEWKVIITFEGFPPILTLTSKNNRCTPLRYIKSMPSWAIKENLKGAFKWIFSVPPKTIIKKMCQKWNIPITSKINPLLRATLNINGIVLGINDSTQEIPGIRKLKTTILNQLKCQDKEFIQKYWGELHGTKNRLAMGKNANSILKNGVLKKVVFPIIIILARDHSSYTNINLSSKVAKWERDNITEQGIFDWEREVYDRILPHIIPQWSIERKKSIQKLTNNVFPQLTKTGKYCSHIIPISSEETRTIIKQTQENYDTRYNHDQQKSVKIALFAMIRKCITAAEKSSNTNMNKWFDIGLKITHATSDPQKQPGGAHFKEIL